MVKNQPTQTFLDVFELSQRKISFFHFFFPTKFVSQNVTILVAFNYPEFNFGAKF